MKTVTVCRIYITESSRLLKPIIKYLHEAKMRGFSVFRAVSGFGDTGPHDASLVVLSINLPLAVEFFDDAEKVEEAVMHLKAIVEPEHIITWTAQTYD